MEVAMLCAFCSCGSISGENPSPEDTNAPQEAERPNNAPTNNNNNNNYVARTNTGGGGANSSTARSGGGAGNSRGGPNNSSTNSTATNKRRSSGNLNSSNNAKNNSCRILPLQISATNAELEQWKRSFDLLMSTTRGQDSFRHFLRSEYSEENMMFWLACEELKEIRDNSQITDKCKQIYEEFISVLSPKEVSIDSRIREIINRNMVNPDTQSFEEAQNQIYQLMKRDSYHRFINSPFFKSLEENAAAATTHTHASPLQPPSSSTTTNTTTTTYTKTSPRPLVSSSSTQNSSGRGGGSNLGRATVEDSGSPTSPDSSKPAANSNSGK
ncbi:regulator of G-protein signaling 17-like [Symsagittifera roscoffensis]|uniref:regulator of G-protein signaling 17-like n=1 Tax=Symsagittifera roscoffensis TaxID=84072 RepID=UPI00307C6CCA